MTFFYLLLWIAQQLLIYLSIDFWCQWMDYRVLSWRVVKLVRSYFLFETNLTIECLSVCRVNAMGGTYLWYL